MLPCASDDARHLLDAADSALLEGFALAAPTSNLFMTSGRLGSGVGALLGLIGVVVGALALARPAGRVGTGSGRLGAVSALGVGSVALARSAGRGAGHDGDREGGSA